MMDEGAGIKALILSLLRMNPPATGPDCSCCQGGTEGDVDQVCDACFDAVTKGDRDGHPHPPSPAQQTLRDQSAESGGIVWPGVEEKTDGV